MSEDRYVIPPTVKAVIFDLNGTMVRDGVYQQLAFRQFFANHHLAVDEETYQKKAANRLNRDIWPALLGRPVGDAEADALIEEKESLYEKAYDGHVAEVEGLSDLLTSLRARGIRLAVATTSHRESAMFVLGELGLQSAFELIVTGDQVSHGKPDPEIYRTALARLGLAVSEVVAFEDSPQGIRAAVAAGVPVVAVLGDYQESDIAGLGASGAVHDFRGVS